MATIDYIETLRARKRRRWRVLIISGLLAFLTFIALNLFGESGILVNMRVNAEHRSLLRERNRLQRERVLLAEEIRAIQTNSRKIEEISREQFGFGRPGEIIFYFPDDPDAPVQKSHNPVRGQGPK